MHAGRQQSSSTSASLPEEKDEEDYPLRKKKKKKKKKKHPTSSPPLLLLLLFFFFCFSVPSPELSFRSKHCPKKETKTAMPKKNPPPGLNILFPLPTQTTTKKFTNLPYKILLTLQTGYVLQPRKRESDRHTDRQSARA
jgi:hypothetical protein